MAKIVSNIFGLDDYDVNIPYVALSEQAEGQKFMQALEEQVHMATGTATGMHGDYDLNQGGMPSGASPQGQPTPNPGPPQLQGKPIG
jgi:hypothetical protein